METKVLYVLTEERDWAGNEESHDVIGVYDTKDQAEMALAELKSDFLRAEKEVIDRIPQDQRDITDNPRYYLFLDEGMGYYYELSICNRTLNK